MIAKELALWALRKRRPWRVQGTSMEPDYRAGDLVLIDPHAALVPGNVIVAHHPFKRVDVIKYVDTVHEDGYVSLRSPSGDDSRQFGRVLVRNVIGTVTWNWKTSRS